ncbi:MAG: hypothetical protein II486_01605, partial [Thermoguttaceae bacterium]|nr:hypothetical protein [Thermoguttaceae bacterium]
ALKMSVANLFYLSFRQRIVHDFSLCLPHDFAKSCFFNIQPEERRYGIRAPSFALQRDPRVYCFEQRDNPDVHVDSAVLAKDPKFAVETRQNIISSDRDKDNDVAFEEIEAKEVRIEVQLQDSFSGGILRWVVK